MRSHANASDAANRHAARPADRDAANLAVDREAVRPAANREAANLAANHDANHDTAGAVADDQAANPAVDREASSAAGDGRAASASADREAASRAAHRRDANPAIDRDADCGTDRVATDRSRANDARRAVVRAGDDDDDHDHDALDHRAMMMGSPSRADAPLVSIAVGLVRGWTRLYTWRLAPVLREARCAEIESDLWECRQDADARWRALGAALAGQILARLLTGIPDDLFWRAEQRAASRERALLRSGRALTFTAVVAVLLLAGLWVISPLLTNTLPTPPARPGLAQRVRAPHPPPPPPPPPPPCPPPALGGCTR